MPSPFELRSLPSERGKSRLYLIQLPFRTSHAEQVDDIVTLARIDGKALEMARSELQKILPGGALRSMRDGPGAMLGEEVFTVPLEEDLALQLALIFEATNTLRSEEKMQTVVDGIRAMPVDEVVYWLKKLRKDESPVSRNALNMMLEAGV